VATVTRGLLDQLGEGIAEREVHTLRARPFIQSRSGNDGTRALTFAKVGLDQPVDRVVGSERGPGVR
jgi:hypothetical protein